MAFDDQTRRRLFKTVTACRNLLTEDFDEQLRSRFGIYAEEGKVLELDRLTGLDDAGREIARLLRERIGHLAAGKGREALGEAVHRLRREQAFTVLNRFAAVRMAEERDLISQSVGAGMQSRGFRVFEQAAGGAALGDQYERYRVYLDCLFDELSLDLGVLFDRADAMGLLFPGEQALRDLFDELNHPDIAPLWAEDETIGWIYQYYNDPEERKRMRTESSAPRNSRELAVRNQFFTPRYVVEFLTDNSLGRIWYEMTKGQTRLKEQCRYLVRRPVEIFLAEGETAPDTPDQEGLSKEELLEQPVHIPHRPLKDPREIRLLDPACGSMHFGLYAFDLYETIYEEAWDLEASNSDLRLLTSDFSSKDAFLREVPRLIIEHNIHGVDIDPRAVQIAALSLWLRAQKSWKDQGLSASDRPQVLRSNVVCAEPMPGSPEILEDFVATLDPPLLGELVKTVFEKMQLAGEAGSLLKIEEEIRTAIDTARKEWLKQRDDLLTRNESSQEEFFDTAEQKVVDTLRAYAEQAVADSYQRRLFADDAARGFAFIDLCRKRYDVALMNPPFGDASQPSKPYIDENYGDTKGDVYKAFVECFHARLVPAGYLGIISSRTGFFLGQSEDWRNRVVLRLFRPIALADLGIGVLDAMVEVAAYVLRSLSEQEARGLTLSIVPVLGKVMRDSQDRFSLPKWQAARCGLKRHQAVAELEHLEAHGFIQRCPGDFVRYTPLWHSVNNVTAPPDPVFPPLVCVRAVEESEKGASIAEAIGNPVDRRKFVVNPIQFTAVPGSPFSYWVTPSIRSLFQKLSSFEGDGREVRTGGQTGDDFRYLRLFWECQHAEPPSTWVCFQKGGSHSPFYSDIPLLVDWDVERKTFRGFVGRPGRPNVQPSSFEYYFRPGLTWPIKNRFSFKPWPMPAGCAFSNVGSAAFLSSNREAIWALMSSSVFTHLIRVTAGWNFEVGVVQRTPIPDVDPSSAEVLTRLAKAAWQERRAMDSTTVISHAFVVPAVLVATGGTLAERAAAWASCGRGSAETVASIQAKIDDLAFRLYDLDEADRAALTSSLPTEAAGDADVDACEDEGEEEEQEAADGSALVSDLLGYSVGCSLGRWDIRYATNERQPPPLPDPFDPLPICPPGMLQNDDGLPADPKDVPSDYPLRITWPGILVDEENHPEDIVARVRESLRVIWGERTDDIEAETCEILGVKAKPKEKLDALRVYFRDPNRFFKDHLARYSKSRRKAPIYWPLSTESGSYTLWIYYHRLDSQTLYTCVSEFIDPKREALGRDLEVLGRRIGAGGSTEERQQLDELTTFLTELKTLRDRLLEVAGLPYRPNLNDGIQITAAPLWKCFRHSPWKKVLMDTWKELKKEKYDWAHLALPIWPGRVVPLCAKDRSIAIAHGLEELLWVPDLSGKKKDQLRPLKSPEDEIKELIKAGHDKKDVERAAGDVETADALGFRGNLWVEVPGGTWRRRLGPKEEIENEVARRRDPIFTTKQNR